MKDFSVGEMLTITAALVLASVIIGFVTPMLAKNFEESFEG